jgi:GT2 family glycosyltransferase
MNNVSEAAIELPKIFVAVAVYNRIHTSVPFVERIMRQSNADFQLIIVDDLSTDGTYEKLTELAKSCNKLTILRTEDNEWWGGCMFLAISYIFDNFDPSDRDAILFMNDDVEFENDLLERFTNAQLKWPDSVLAGLPISEGKIHGPGSNMLCWPLALTARPHSGKLVSDKTVPDAIPIEFQFGHGTLYPVKILRKIGNIAKEKLPHYHGDGELSYRAVRAGYRSLVIRDIPLYCDTKSTGRFNSMQSSQRFSDIIPSLFEFKSINNIKHRWHFAQLAAPSIWRTPYFFSQTVKSILRSVYIVVKHK